MPNGTSNFQYSYRYETSVTAHIGTAAAVGSGVADSGTLFHTTGPVHNVVNRYEKNRHALVRKENREIDGNFPWSNYNYAVNDLGQRDSLSLTIDPLADGSAVTTTAVGWDYNSRDELVTADHQTPANKRAYKYDSIGNRIETVNGATAFTGISNYTANPVNEYTKAEGNSLPTGAYDDDGNLKNDGNRAYFWDAENRLVRVMNSAATTLIAEFVYDYQSRRIAKHSAALETNQLFFYHGWNLIAEYTYEEETDPIPPDEPEWEWRIAKSYTWGLDLSGSLQGAGGVGGLLSVRFHEGPDADDYFPTFDGNGNVSEYIASSGDRVAHYQYDPFGKQTAESTGSLKDSFAHRFSTKYLDQETGFYYYGYRYYDPITGRWPSRDPIEEEGGINLFGFLGNDATNETDYLGLDFIVAGTRPLEGIMGVFGGEGKFANHMAIVYFSESSPGCSGLKVGDEFTVVPHCARMGPGVELLPTPGYGWIRTRIVSNINGKGARRQDFKSHTDISSVEVMQKTPVRYHVVRVCANQRHWRRIMETSNNYPFAEQGLRERPKAAILKWPQSKYEIPPEGNNSNSFVRKVLSDTGHSVSHAFFNQWNHPGAFFPRQVNDWRETPSWLGP